MTSRPKASRSVWLIIALLAMTLHALVPAGYMIAPKETAGAIDVLLCSGQTQTHVKVDVETGDILPDFPTGPASDDEGDPRSSKMGAPCVFAAAGVVAPPVLGPSLTAPLAVPLSNQTVYRSVAPGRGLAAPPPWATGPPSDL